MSANRLGVYTQLSVDRYVSRPKLVVALIA